IKGSEFKDGAMFNDMLVEVDAQGRVVWRWHANAHLNPDSDIIGPLHKREAWCHANSVAVLKNGNILLTSRSLDAMLVIEKRSGKIIWRWGSTAYLDKTASRLEMRSGPNTLGGPHGAEQIPTGLPGAGHIICYDNGMYGDASRAVEVDFATRKLIWQSSQPGIGRKHFSNFVSNAQRLPNGNTLICDGANGRFFQVTKDNQTVWEYINPYITSPQYQGAVFRAYQYSPEYCPQFKALAPARGAAVIPPPNSLLRMPPAR
ncbi:MAG TPA: aryl-sulfate sulfotransferase, partial [Abditibacteriaceae bacterium]|nr:aryl-sulfate sulfotransferase [Abditibacteriaceae bacterium]